MLFFDYLFVLKHFFNRFQLLISLSPTQRSAVDVFGRIGTLLPTSLPQSGVGYTFPFLFRAGFLKPFFSLFGSGLLFLNVSRVPVHFPTEGS